MFKNIAIAFLLLALLLAGCASSSDFGALLAQLDAIDARHNVSLNDYHNGLTWLRSHPRWPNPFNVPEIEQVLEEYGALLPDSATSPKPEALLLTFRIALLEAERHYKLSYKSSLGDIIRYPLKCSNREYILDSINHQNASIEALGRALSAISDLREYYPKEYALLNLSEEMLQKLANERVDFEAEIAFKEESYNAFCTATEGISNCASDLDCRAGFFCVVREGGSFRPVAQGESGRCVSRYVIKQSLNASSAVDQAK